MKNIYMLLVSIIILSIAGCESTTTVKDEAVQLTMTQLTNTQGYFWFKPQMDEYIPDTSFTNQIKKAYQPGTHKIVYYVSMTCTCNTPQPEFPHCLKSCQFAAIPESAFELYSLASISYTYPYKTILTLNQIPGIFVFKNGIPVYSVVDTMKNVIKMDSTKKPNVEEYLLKGLLK